MISPPSPPTFSNPTHSLANLAFPCLPCLPKPAGGLPKPSPTKTGGEPSFISSGLFVFRFLHYYFTYLQLLHILLRTTKLSRPGHTSNHMAGSKGTFDNRTSGSCCCTTCTLCTNCIWFTHSKRQIRSEGDPPATDDHFRTKTRQPAQICRGREACACANPAEANLKFKLNHPNERARPFGGVFPCFLSYPRSTLPFPGSSLMTRDRKITHINSLIAIHKIQQLG